MYHIFFRWLSHVVFLPTKPRDGNGSSPDQPEPSSQVALGILLLITLLFAPLFLYAEYTLRTVLPALAIVENPKPTAYEAVGSDDSDAVPAAAAYTENGVTFHETAPSAPYTSSLRRTHRLLVAAGGGWRGCYRGLKAALVLRAATWILTGVVSLIPFVPMFLAQLVASLLVVQLSTAWVHSVLRSSPATGPGGSGLFAALRSGQLPFRRTFEATCMPVALYCVATLAVTSVANVLADVLNLLGVTPDEDADVAVWSFVLYFSKCFAFLASVLVLSFILVLPAYVVLVRVQASLLPPDDDVIVPFDRSFGGTVEPVVAGGRGYVTMRDALRSFSYGSLKRVALMYVKTTLVSLLVGLTFSIAVAPIFLFMWQQS